jgi:putative aminopeptidase FrvX
MALWPVTWAERTAARRQGPEAVAALNAKERAAEAKGGGDDPETSAMVASGNLASVAEGFASERLTRAHEREMAKRNATPHNMGWATTESSIASKTDKGVLTTLAGPGSKFTHSWMKRNKDSAIEDRRTRKTLERDPRKRNSTTRRRRSSARRSSAYAMRQEVPT